MPTLYQNYPGMPKTLKTFVTQVAAPDTDFNPDPAARKFGSGKQSVLKCGQVGMYMDRT
jgi:hypothetical protein